MAVYEESYEFIDFSFSNNANVIGLQDLGVLRKYYESLKKLRITLKGLITKPWHRKSALDVLLLGIGPWRQIHPP